MRKDGKQLVVIDNLANFLSVSPKRNKDFSLYGVHCTKMYINFCILSDAFYTVKKFEFFS
jgi:hypothetical protein